MKRFPDWISRLEVFLQESNGRRFQYGAWDCGLFVCGAIAAMTGVDPAVEIRGAYDSARGLRELTLGMCGARSVKALAEWLAARSGMAEIPPRFARRGDALLLKRGGDCSLGLVALDGARVLVLGAAGVAAIARTEVSEAQAWLVG